MNGLYNYATRFFSGSLWTPPSEKAKENEQKEESFPLMKLAKCLPEVFGNVVSNCKPKDMRNLKITCRDMKSILESDKCQNAIAAIFFPKILEDFNVNNLRLIIKDNGVPDVDLAEVEDILEILSKINPKLALEIISQFYIDNKSTIKNFAEKNRSNSVFLNFGIGNPINKELPFVKILKTLHGLLKTTEAKKTFISTLEIIFFVYDYNTIYVTDEIIDLVSKDADYILNSKNPNVVEFLNKWSIKDKLLLLIQLGDKADSKEQAKGFYLQAAEIINSIDLNSLNRTRFPNPLEHLALAAQIAKRIQEFDPDKANIILKKINEVYQKIEQHIEFRDICAGYYGLVEVLPDMKDSLLEKAKTLFSQADIDNKIYYLNTSIMPEKLLKELCDHIPKDLLLNFVHNPQALLKIADVAVSLEAYSVAVQVIENAISSQNYGFYGPDFIKKLIELDKVDTAINLANAYERIDLLMVIALNILVSNPEKANSLIDEKLELLRRDEEKRNRSFFSKLVFVKDPTFSRRDILAGYYHIIEAVATFDPQRAHTIAIEALKFREKYKKEGLLTVPCQALKCLFQDPMQGHFILNNYTFSENEKTFFALTTLDQCKNSSIKTKFFSELDKLNSSSGKEEE